MQHHYTHVNFGFEVVEIQHAVDGAIDTILAFAGTLSDLETRLKELLRALQEREQDAELIYAIVKVLATVRFHFEEAAEYREILQRMAPPKVPAARAIS
ncbi:MAG: hypothetical protein HY342_05520 [Candidatus Lambdaproteobacteria bacterium]|nr:hypothetical protein [Candidatus Lambdaproteobacteria bacterium]